MGAAFRTHEIQVGSQKTHGFRKEFGGRIEIGCSDERVVIPHSATPSFLAVLFHPGHRQICKERDGGEFLDIFTGVYLIVYEKVNHKKHGGYHQAYK